jgi:hypothetical protein
LKRLRNPAYYAKLFFAKSPKANICCSPYGEARLSFGFAIPMGQTLDIVFNVYLPFTLIITVRAVQQSGCDFGALSKTRQTLVEVSLQVRDEARLTPKQKSARDCSALLPLVEQ